MSNSGQVVSMVQEKNMSKILQIYDTVDMQMEVRLAIVSSHITSNLFS